MTQYSVQPTETIRFLLFDKNMGKNIGEIISKNLSSKYSQKLLIIPNNQQLMYLKLVQKE